MKITFRIRTYSDAPAAPSAWLMLTDGPAQTCLMIGYGLMSSMVEKLASWFAEKGVKVEREERSYVATSCKPGTVERGEVTEPDLFKGVGPG